MKYCQKCGKEINVGICSYCNQNKKAQIQKKPIHINILPYIIMILSISSLIILIVLLVSSNRVDDNLSPVDVTESDIYIDTTEQISDSSADEEVYTTSETIEDNEIEIPRKPIEDNEIEIPRKLEGTTAHENESEIVKHNSMPQSINLNTSKIELKDNEQYQFTTNVTMETESYDASSKKVTWSSSDSSVASVDQSGKLSSHKPGSVVITAKTVNNLSATCVVTVAGVAKIDVGKSTLILEVGKSYEFAVSLTLYGNADNSVILSSSNSKIASVNGFTVTAKSVGTATITFTSKDGVTASCSITVNAPSLTGITLNKSSLLMIKGEQSKLTVSLVPSGAVATIIWASSNVSIAKVDNSGDIIAIENGTVNITATAGKYQAVCKVTVNSSETLDTDYDSSKFDGGDAKPIVSYSDEQEYVNSIIKNGNYKNLSYVSQNTYKITMVTTEKTAELFAFNGVKLKSNNTNIAKTDGMRIIAVSAGDTVINVMDSGGNNLVNINVTVLPDSYKITFKDKGIENIFKETFGSRITVADMKEIVSFTYDPINYPEMDEELYSIDDLKYCINMETIHITNQPFNSISACYDMWNLNEIYIFACNVSELYPLENKNSLTWVLVTGNPIYDASPVFSLPNLINFGAYWGTHITDISALKNTKSLEVFGCPNNLLDTSPLLNHVNLKYITLLEVSQNEIYHLFDKLDKLENISLTATPLTNRELELIQKYKLRTLMLYGCGISNLSFLKGQSGISDLRISSEYLTDISGIEELTGLNWCLDLCGCNITDVSPLLKLLDIPGISELMIDLSGNPIKNKDVLLPLKEKCYSIDIFE